MVFMLRLILGLFLAYLTVVQCVDQLQPHENNVKEYEHSQDIPGEYDYDGSRSEDEKSLNSFNGRIDKKTEPTIKGININVKNVEKDSKPTSESNSTKLNKSEPYRKLDLSVEPQVNTEKINDNKTIPFLQNSRQSDVRSINIDIDKYTSTDFHDINNVYTVPDNEDTKKYYSEFIVEPTTEQPAHAQSHFLNVHQDLTTPRTKYFDTKYKQTVDSVNQKLEQNSDIDVAANEGNSGDNDFLSKENSEKLPKNSTLDYSHYKRIEKNDTEEKNSINKDLTIEQASKVTLQTSYNDTLLIDISTDENEVNKDGKISLINGGAYEGKRNESGMENITTRTSVDPTTKKSEIIKYSTNKSDDDILNNKIETESIQYISSTIPVPTITEGRNFEKSATTVSITGRGSIKYSHYQSTTPTSYNRRPGYRNKIDEENKINKTMEQIVQENQIIPILVVAPKINGTTTTEKSVIEFFSTFSKNIPDREPKKVTGETAANLIFERNHTKINIASNLPNEINNTIEESTTKLSEGLGITGKNTSVTTILIHNNNATNEYTTESSATKTSNQVNTITTTELEHSTFQFSSTVTNEQLTTGPTTEMYLSTSATEFAITDNPVWYESSSSHEYQTESNTGIAQNYSIVSDTATNEITLAASISTEIISNFTGTATTAQTTIAEFTTPETTTAEPTAETTIYVTNSMMQDGTTREIFSTTEGLTFETTENTQMGTERSTQTHTEGTTETISETPTEEVTETTIALNTSESENTKVSEITASVITETVETSTNEMVTSEITSESYVPTTTYLATDYTTETTTEFKKKLTEHHTSQTITQTEETISANLIKNSQLENRTTYLTNKSRTIGVTQSTTDSVSESGSESTTRSSESNQVDDPETGNGTIIAIVISSVGAICLIAVAALLVIMRKRQKRFNYGERCRPVSLDDYSVDNVSVFNSVRRKAAMRSSKRSYGNPAFEDPVCTTHPLNFPAISKFTANEEDVQAEFQDIPQITARACELPEGCETKNRYANVIPLPETRVFLKAIDGYPNSDYINANYVTGPKNTRCYYIACQAPLSNTVDDFWRMIWEQQSKLILMVTHLFENGVEKCVDYLPPSEVLDCHRLFGDYQVTLKKREVKDKYIISKIQLKNMVSNSWREVTHFWYLGWPEKGVPLEGNSLIAFLIEARSYMKSATIDKKEISNGDVSNGKSNEVNPVVVHCSPGTGRTGAVIACDIAIREFEQTRQVDIPKIVYKIRRDRASAVQTKEQYAFIYKVISLYATKLTGGGLDSF